MIRFSDVKALIALRNLAPKTMVPVITWLTICKSHKTQHNHYSLQIHFTEILYKLTRAYIEKNDIQVENAVCQQFFKIYF